MTKTEIVEKFETIVYGLRTKDKFDIKLMNEIFNHYDSINIDETNKCYDFIVKLSKSDRDYYGRININKIYK